MLSKMELDYQPLGNAVAALTLALTHYDRVPAIESDLRNILRSACIKNFEVAYELVWKGVRRWLLITQDAERVEGLYSRGDLFRMAAQCGVIADPEAWFAFHQARNQGAHIYHEDIAQRSLASARAFIATATQLVTFFATHYA